MEGWIKLYRKIRNNPIFNDLQLYRLWSICLLEATHRPHDQLVGRQIIRLGLGQFVAGRFELQDVYNKGLKNKDRVSDTTIWRWMKHLESWGYINIKSHNKYSIISIVNWRNYQSEEENDRHQIASQNEQVMDNKCSSNKQEMHTNKNVENEENEKNGKKEETISPDGAVDLKIKDFRQRYSLELLHYIDEYMDMIRHTRKSAKLAESVKLKIYQYFDQFPPICVEYAVRTHTETVAYHSKDEKYTFGIVRRTTADEAAKKLAAGQKPKQLSEEELLRRLEEKDREENGNAELIENH